MKWMRYSARVLVIVWAAFWILFAVGSLLTGGDGHAVSAKEQRQGILAVSVIVVAALGCVYLAFRQDLVSGICLSLIGLSITIWRSWGQSLFAGGHLLQILLMLGGPPLLAGVLFLIRHWRTKRATKTG